MSGPEELDTAVLELDTLIDGVTKSDACSIAEHLPTAANKDRIYIIGHPAGRTLSYSLQDNLLLGCKPPKLHYRTPTEPGSSGSPLFDASWRLIGIHHAGDKNMPRLDGKGTYSANEGISIHAVRGDCRVGPRAPGMMRGDSPSRKAEQTSSYCFGRSAVSNLMRPRSTIRRHTRLVSFMTSTACAEEPALTQEPTWPSRSPEPPSASPGRG